MNKIFYLILLLAASSLSYGAITAITENGDTVILKEDGSWHYKDTNTVVNETIETNKTHFIKGEKSSFNLKSKITGASFWIDPKEWSFKRDDSSETSEYSLKAPDTDLYGMVISEGLEVKPEELVKLAFENARNVAADMRVVKKEYRIVNGIKVIHMIMRGTIQSIDFTYIGYYHSNNSGSTQYLTYTGTNLVPKYKDKIYSLLNGFDVQK
ncbi:hypothetical protein [Candidatus Thiodiazotropha sp. CDECU1]|uniref:hypothetical protein n=1 Tax=Candidatus Thiodiazotropha sp. CDECU1 TaxID=3065865 RepID=UPI00292CDAE8|nr:hypothetical protein [Candidatus Thiodiazotropha sp. CDECU1]